MTPPTKFTIATFEIQSSSKDGSTYPKPAVGINNSYFELEHLLQRTQQKIYPSTLSIFQDWNNAYPQLAAIAEQLISGQLQAEPLPPPPSCSSSSFSTTTTTIPRQLTPIIYPSKLLAVGANYASHLREMNLPVEKWEPMPFFTRPPTSTLVGPGRTNTIPPSTKQFDWECELAVVVGSRLRRASRAEAAAAIAGYTIGLDMTCRDLIVAGRGLGTDLMRGKSQDTMAPCGPHVVPAALVGDVDGKGLRITLDVNGERRMDASTGEMVYKCDEILSIISQHVTLEPGDIVLTGSPAGSAGAHGNRWLRSGDEIRAEIEGVGVLEVSIKDDGE
jgi:2,4-didehydro-3-deoxy-L-rhamnonate hydrolase